MKKHFRKVGLFLTSVFVAYLFFFDYSAALSRRLPILQSLAAKNGLTFELNRLKLTSPTTLQFEGFNSTFGEKAEAIPLSIESGTISTKILPLFLFDTVIETSLQAYNGLIELSWINNIISREASFSFNAQQIDLLKHPTTFAAGFSGKLKAEGDFSLTGSQFSEFTVGAGDLHIEVTDGHYNGGHTIFRAIQSPEIRDITINLYAKQFPQRIGITSLDIFSSLGRASGSGFIHLNGNNNIERGRIELNARLTPEGAKLFGGYFALGAGQPIDNPSRNWKVLVTKGKNAPWDFQVRPQA